MAFRFRRRTRLFPGVSLNWSKNGLSSISVGPRGATWNIPVNRSGPATVTAGLPGTGLSVTEPVGSSVRERRQKQRTTPALPTTEAMIAEVMQTLAGPEHVGDALWRQGLAQLVIDHPDAPRNVREAALMIRSPEAVELHLRRAKGRAATVRAANEALKAVDTVLAWAMQQGLASSD